MKNLVGLALALMFFAAVVGIAYIGYLLVLANHSAFAVFVIFGGWVMVLIVGMGIKYNAKSR